VTDQRDEAIAYWDPFWHDYQLPREITGHESVHAHAILEAFERFRPLGAETVLEVGGAPGQYTAALAHRFGYRPSVLDISAAGCAATRRNFELLGIDGDVFEGDLLDPSLDLPRFDVVYSLGVVEELPDPFEAIGAQVRFVRPGGVLVFGVPSLLGLNGRIAARLSPSLLETMDARVMDVDRWPLLEQRYGLRPLFTGYVGGFEPAMFWQLESGRLRDRTLFIALKVARRAMKVPPFTYLRALGGSRVGYALGVYSAPE